MKNIGNVITKHNNKLLFQSFEQPTQMCNCRDKVNFPQTQINSANLRKYYLGTSEDEFKTRCNNHKRHSETKVMKRKLNFQNMIRN